MEVFVCPGTSFNTGPLSDSVLPYSCCALLFFFSSSKWPSSSSSSGSLTFQRQFPDFLASASEDFSLNLLAPLLLASESPLAMELVRCYLFDQLLAVFSSEISTFSKSHLPFLSAIESPFLINF